MPASNLKAFLDRTLRTGLVLAGLGVMMWAATSSAGCAAGNGKYTTKHKNAAKEKMDGMKAATEYQMGLQSLLAGDLDKARRHANSSLALAPKVARTHVLSGRIAMEKNELERASDAFAQAELLDAQNVDSFYFRGLLAERLLRREEALGFYLQAAELEPNDPQYSLAAAEVMIDLGRRDEAKSYILSAGERFRHTAGIQQTLGHIAVLEGDLAQAEELFGQARLLAPDQLEIVEDLARVQFSLGKFSECEANLAKVTASDDFKNRRDIHHMRAQCLIAMERLLDARNVLLSLTGDEEGESDLTAWTLLGQTAYKLRDANRVRTAYTRIISIDPKRPDGYVLKGLQLRRMGNFQGAEQAFRQAAEIEPTAEVLVLLGLTYERLNEPELARRCYQAAQQLDPSHELAGRLAKDQQAAKSLAGVTQEQ